MKQSYHMRMLQKTFMSTKQKFYVFYEVWQLQYPFISNYMGKDGRVVLQNVSCLPWKNLISWDWNDMRMSRFDRTFLLKSAFILNSQPYDLWSQSSGAHQCCLMCLRVFEVDDLQSEGLLHLCHVCFPCSLKQRVTLKFIWMGGKESIFREMMLDASTEGVVNIIHQDKVWKGSNWNCTAVMQSGIMTAKFTFRLSIMYNWTIWHFNHLNLVWSPLH